MLRSSKQRKASFFCLNCGNTRGDVKDLKTKGSVPFGLSDVGNFVFIKVYGLNKIVW